MFVGSAARAQASCTSISAPRGSGARCPVRNAGFATESPPAREVLADSRTMKGGGAAGVATLGPRRLQCAGSCRGRVLLDGGETLFERCLRIDTVQIVESNVGGAQEHCISDRRFGLFRASRLSAPPALVRFGARGGFLASSSRSGTRTRRSPPPWNGRTKRSPLSAWLTGRPGKSRSGALPSRPMPSLLRSNNDLPPRRSQNAGEFLAEGEAWRR